MLMPTPFEQYMLELVNAARADPGAAAEKYGFTLGNIADQALEPLAMNEDLLEAARAHSQWMEQTDTFSHNGSGGSSPTERATGAGWDGNGVGENIAGWFSFGQSDINQQEVVEERHGGLLRSPGHLANIMNPNWSEAGIGEATGDWQGQGTNYDSAFLYTQNFSDRGNSYLTGVAFDDEDGDNFYDVGEGLGNVNIQITDSDGNVVNTTTWDAGGYQIALEDGAYNVRFSGGGINGVIEKQVTIAGGNVKLDLNEDAESPVVADNDPTNTDDPAPADPSSEPTGEMPGDETPEDENPGAETPGAETPPTDSSDQETPTPDDPSTANNPDPDEPEDPSVAETPDTPDPEISDDQTPPPETPEVAETPDTEQPDPVQPDPEQPEAENTDDEAPGLAAGPSIVNGTDGDDVFMNTTNDQIILGGAGNDRFETEGRFDDYDFRILPNNGVLLAGAEKTNVLFDVETLEFSDLSILFRTDSGMDDSMVSNDRLESMGGGSDASGGNQQAEMRNCPFAGASELDDMAFV